MSKKLLKIYVGESQRWQGQSLYQAIVYKLKEKGFAGVTVLRGVEGYGQDKVVHTTRILEMSADLPMIVECIDSKEKIEGILPEITEMVSKGLVFTLDVDTVGK